VFGFASSLRAKFDHVSLTNVLLLVGSFDLAGFQSGMANSLPAESKPLSRRSKGSASNQRHRLLLIALAFALLAASMLQYRYLMATDLPMMAAKQSAAMLSDFAPLNISNPKFSEDVALKSTRGEAVADASRKQRVRVPNYHVIFSTSCVPLQHWQSYLFFYSAMKVGQPGNVVC
jgi:hypothetical protein